MYTPVKMSFFSIPDPIERDRVVKDYERMKREIHERSENRKIMGQNRNRTLQETFHPIVKAQTEMTEKIVKSLQENPIKREKIAIPSKREKIAIPSKKRRLSSADEFGPLESSYRNRYMSRADDIDTSFGISFLPNGEPYIGNTPIKIEDDDIIIYSEVYPGTPGLWSLITEKKKANLEVCMMKRIWLSTKKYYVKQMLYTKILIRIPLTQEVAVHGNGKLFSHLSGKNGKRMAKETDRD